jgi:hypothetical protein
MRKISVLQYWYISFFFHLGRKLVTHLVHRKIACECAGPAPKAIKVSAASQLQIYWQGATDELLNKPGTGNT